MMDCKIIQDLLPLYADSCCSEETNRAVEEHLKTCADCRTILRGMHEEICVPDLTFEEVSASQTVKKGFKQLRRRLLASLLAVVVLIVTVRIGWNQFRGEGLCPTNLNEYRICTAFLRELVQDDYEGAYRYFDIDDIRRDWAKWAFDDEKMDALEENGLTMFLESSTALKAEGLTDFHYLHAYRTEGSYRFFFSVTVGQTTDTLQLLVNDQGIESILGGNGYLPAPDALTQMSMWREYLWRDYSGCYFDWEARTYVYENQN